MTSPPRKAGEPDRARLALADHAVAREHAVGLQIAAQRRGCRFAELQRGAGGRIDLVPVVHFDDLDVVVVAEALRGKRDQLEQHVDADAHIRRIDQRDRSAGLGQRFFVGLAQARRADHRADAGAGAGVDVSNRRRRPGEVDQDVGVAERSGKVGTDHHAGDLSERPAGIVAQQRAAGDLQRGGKLHVLLTKDRRDQRLAHASTAARDRDADRPRGYCHQPSFRSNADSQLSSLVLGALVSDLSSTASPPPARATCAGGGGISSPSQRATLSSTK